MKKIIFALASMVFLFSCTKNHNSIKVEDVTEGSKWNLEIGSTQEEVYQQIVELGMEKDFDFMNVVNRPYYDSPEDIEGIFPYYNVIGLILSPQQIQDRVYFVLGDNKVDSIYNGLNQLSKVNQWPMSEKYDDPILPGDTFDELYQKLEELYSDSYYSNYKIAVDVKPLDKPFDPGMKKFSQWSFQFMDDMEGNVTRQNEVTVQFGEDGNLAAIRVVYQDSKK